MQVNNDSATYMWHCRLGHIGVKCMKKLYADGLLESLDACKSYHMGKMTESLIFSKMELESNLLEVIHFDVCSPMSAEACSGYCYILTSQMI